MLNTRWFLGLVLVVSTVLPACNTNTSLGREGVDASGREGDAQPGPRCVFEPTQVYVGCNEDRNLDWTAGICQDDGTCLCQSGFVLNPTTNRCRLVAGVDAAVATCTPGVDLTCSDQKDLEGAGTCAGKGGCFCNAGFVINPATGRCRPAPVTDAGAKTDSAAGTVCTFLLDQTCNDDDLFSGLAGVCTKEGVCSCGSGFVLNPATGRCRTGAKPDAGVTPDTWVAKDTVADTVDAPVPSKDLGKDSPGVCTFGMNQTCNDNPIYSWVAGTCQSNGTCVCASGFVLNASGLCAPLPKDAGPDLTDVKTACTPGMDQTCGDGPAALWGTCQSNGTCLCKDGYVINPSTGKCMIPEASTCSGSYIACGCGCCTTTTASPACYYPSAEESVSTIKAADEASKSRTNCSLVGCSMGVRYLCCTEATAEPAGSAQYSATYTVGGYDRIGLKKTGSDGDCMSFSLVSPGVISELRPLRVSAPTNWGIEGAISAGACSSSSPEQAIGAQGTVTFSPNGTSCAINAHMTVFFYAAASGTVSTRRIDADNVPINGGAPAGFCK